MARYKRRTVTMPASFHPDDGDWIEVQLAQVSSHHQAIAIQGYNKVYDRHMNETDIEHKRSNLARCAANIRLRIYIAKVQSLKPQGNTTC